MSDSLDIPRRLDGIETQWTLVRRAHADGSTADEARHSLVTRYSTSIRSYVRAVMKGSPGADEVAQDVVVKLLQGDFAGADPKRGRFRDLMKVAVRNTIRKWWERENRRQGVAYDVGLTESPAGDPADAEWDSAWRGNLLELAWSALEEYQKSTPGSIAYTLMRLRTESPDASSEELAEQLGAKLGRKVRADALRQQLRRARMRFAELLIDEIASGLDQPTSDRIEEELVALGLLEYVRELLPEGWKERK